MAAIVVLEDVELVPALELEALRFSTQERAWPAASRHEMPDAWCRYWLDSLADAGVTGLSPIYPGSDHVATTAFINAPVLEAVLRGIVRGWGGVESLSDPEGVSVLNGGLVLCTPAEDVLVEPGCCSDFRTLGDWRAAAAYRGVEWQMVWVGHPWVSVRWESPWLILSQPHEGDAPEDRWAVSPDDLTRALDRSTTELQRFAGQLAGLLPSIGYRDDPGKLARTLAGLSE